MVMVTMSELVSYPKRSLNGACYLCKVSAKMNASVMTVKQGVENVSVHFTFCYGHC